jgi:hypothetical protein
VSDKTNLKIARPDVKEMVANAKARMLGQAQALVATLNLSTAPGGRDALARALGFGLDAPDRNVDAECGYPDAVSIDQFRRMYERNGIAQRVVEVFPNECWAGYPSLYETERPRQTAFERAWLDLTKRIPLWSVLHRADKVSGLGRYGVVYLGFDDTSAGYGPDKAVRPDGPRKLLYAQTFAEDMATVVDIDRSPWSPRHGLPVAYDVTVGEVRDATGLTLTAGQKVRVHWTRCVHLADGIESNLVYAKERMRAVFNFLLDLRKVLGGSAEMFWKGAFPGFSLEMLPEYLGTPQDDETIRQQMDDYHNHLQRYIALEGFKVNPISPQISDPTNHVAQLVNVICATLGIPVRIFMGSESGHLASTQDTGNWQRRVKERRELYLEPFVIRPTVDRLIQYGALPAPRRDDYIIKWPDSMTISDKDRADLALKGAQALMQYVTSGAEKVMPLPIFLTKIMSFTDQEADAVLSEMEKNKLYTKEIWDQTLGPQGGGRNGAANGGRPANSSTSA